MNILLLEDDPILCETLKIFLTKAGHMVTSALTMEEVETFTFENSYDLYLFDINLPEGNGLELLQSLRYAEDNTPTIFITALTDMHSMAKGFQLGAIDYIKKPFNPEELLIRIEAKFTTQTIVYKHLEYDPTSRLIRSNNHIVDLAEVQLRVFEKLLQHQGSLVHKEILYECLERVSNTALRVAVSKIQQKLDIKVKNIRSKGYMLEKL